MNQPTYTPPHRTHIPWVLLAAGVALLIGTSAGPTYAQVGHVLSGVGPVDQGWAGAGTAHPQDALSALHWNPAAIAGRNATTLDVSLQVLMPTGSLSSSVDANAFGPGFPSGTVSGTTDSHAGPFPIPAIAYVHAPATSPWAFGVSAFGVGGFGVDYDADPTNPLTTPQPPNGFGFGPVFSEFQLLQVSPTVAFRVNDHVSVGVAPTFDAASLAVSPFPATPPDDANGDGYPSYPNAPREWAMGYGVQVGVQLHDLGGFHVGASMKSTQYFADFEFTSTDEMQQACSFSFNLDYPMILSFGIGYSGVERLELAADVRYIDFANTDGFGDAAFDATGAVTGFGWNSIFAVAAGVQYRLTDRLPVRVGYSYNENPVSDDVSFFNIPSPAIIQHRIGGGFSYDVNRALMASMAVQYGFKNETEGTWVTPLGPVSGTMVRNELSTFFLVLGLEVKL